MKFLVDADLPNSAVCPFRKNGYEANHVRYMGLGTSPDSEIAEFANQEGYTLVTRDQGFGNPTFEPKVEEGTIIVRLHNYSPGELRQRIDGFLRNLDPGEVRGSILVVEKSRYRINKQFVEDD